jgi:nickel/cobalt exporter
MPLIAEPVAAPAPPRRTLLLRLLVAVAATGLVAALIGLGLSLVPAPALPKSPFGMGVREAAPAATGIGGVILALQAQLDLALRSALSALRTSGAGLWTLIGIGLGYGIFHAAGPGHGKALIAAYIVSSGSAIRRGLALSGAAAVIQGLVAIGLVGTIFVLFRATASTMNVTADLVERASFLVMTALGCAMVWRKAGAVLSAAGPAGQESCGCGPACVHGGLGASLKRSRGAEWREMAGIAVAAGIRPCSGAILILVLALSQGLFAAGIAAVLAMAAGTAITTGAIAVVTVYSRALAYRMMGERADRVRRWGAVAELMAAAFVLVLGATLLIGMWRGQGLA